MPKTNGCTHSDAVYYFYEVVVVFVLHIVKYFASIELGEGIGLI